MRPLLPGAEKGTTGPHMRSEPSLPQVFGRYLLVQRLSRGGMGEIFLAKHGLAGFEKLAVIKKVLPHLAADQQFISRFVDEAQVAIKLQHVNIAQVFEVGRVGEEYFLALEYVEGRDLRRTLSLLGQKKQRLPVDLALFIGRELANGLAYAHRRTTSDGASLNLVHCDISPPNVLVSFEGETKVIDFGIAKSAMRGTATDPKMGFGKFGYMAPEQLIRGGIVDHRTDIYAAGVVLFELLTGKRLYEAGPEPDYRALAKKVAKGEHDLPSDVDRVLAPYDDLVATALRPKADDRYQTAAEFRDAIQQALVAVNPTISTDQLGSFMRELFSEEMTAQRELHERVAKAHLSDFHDQLTSQTGTTISFAFASLSLTETPPLKKAALPPPRPGAKLPEPPVPRPPTVPTEILPQSPIAPASQTGAIPTTELSLADGTGTGAPSGRIVLAPRRWPKVAAGFAGVALVGGIVFAFTRGSTPRTAPAPAAAASTGPLVESIPPDQQDPPIQPQVAPQVAIAGSAAAGSSSAAPALPPAPVPQMDPPEVTHHGRHVGSHSSHGAVRATHKVEPRAAVLDRNALVAKFQAVSREYESYKAKNGGRLDAEWNDLAGFIQFHPTELESASRRIDTFRARMREP